jgi:hypothetical protein
LFFTTWDLCTVWERKEVSIDWVIWNLGKLLHLSNWEHRIKTARVFWYLWILKLAHQSTYFYICRSSWTFQKLICEFDLFKGPALQLYIT